MGCRRSPVRVRPSRPLPLVGIQQVTIGQEFFHVSNSANGSRSIRLVESVLSLLHRFDKTVLQCSQWNEAQKSPAACDGESVPGCVKLTYFRPSTVANVAASATAVQKKGGIPRGLDRGRDSPKATPPSEPDKRISRIRLSSQQCSPFWRLMILRARACTRLYSPCSSK